MYYALNILLPCVAISVLVLIVFCLPCESGEKISLSITTLVALTVFQMTIADNIPKTSTHTPILGIGLISLTGMSILSIVATVCILKLFYMPDDVNMPRWFNTIVFRCLAKIACSKSVNEEGQRKKFHEPGSVNPVERKEVQSSCGDGARAVNENNQKKWVSAARILDKFMLYVFTIAFLGISAFCSVHMFVT
ncbi:CHRNA7-FAM7A fusion protein-like [Lineus longissimus]|uniref:CHRNA7-FAM7A fusion protein-like n=1 Tax=Lineus longissimus TaxID=88925 RepID=UPI00315DDBE4